MSSILSVEKTTKKRRPGRPASGGRSQRLTVMLTPEQLEFCRQQAETQGLLVRVGRNIGDPAPGLFVVNLVEKVFEQKK